MAVWGWWHLIAILVKSLRGLRPVSLPPAASACHSGAPPRCEAQRLFALHTAWPSAVLGASRQMGRTKKAPWQLDVYAEDEKGIMDEWVAWLHHQKWRVGRWRRVRIGTPVQYRAHILQSQKTDGFLVHIRASRRYDLYFYEDG